MFAVGMIITGMNLDLSGPDLVVSTAFIGATQSILLISLVSALGFAGAFFYGRKQWSGKNTRLLTRNLQLEKNSHFLKNRVLGFGNLLSQIVMETDATGRILFLHGPWRRLGFPDDISHDRPTRVFHLIHPEDRTLFRTQFDSMVKDCNSLQSRVRLLGPNGLILPVRVASMAVCEPGTNSVSSLRFAFEDITREEIKSRALSQKQAVGEAITTIMKSFADVGANDLDQALAQALKPVAKLVGADRCLMTEVAADQVEMRQLFIWNTPGGDEGPNHMLFESLNDCPWLKEAMVKGETLRILDTAELPDEAEFCRRKWQENQMNSVMCQPILVEGTLQGILVFCTVGRSATWDDEDMRLFGVLASIYAGAKQRQAHQRLLKVANNKFESIVEFLPDATFVINRKREVVAWNRAMVQLTGVEKEEMIGQGDYAYAVPFYGERLPTLINHFGDVDLGQWRQLYSFVEINGNTLYAESFVPFLNDGQGAYLWLTASALYDEEGQVIGAIQSVRDVTYRRKAEQALRNSEDRYRRLVETMNDGMGVVSPGGTITYANDSLCQMMRLNREELLGTPIQTLFSNLLGDVALAEWSGWKMPAGEALEMDLPRRDGTTLPARISPAAIVDEEGKFQGGFAIISDLTRMREAEANIHKLNEGLEQRVVESTRELLATNSALRQSEARYRRIIESLQDGYIFYSQDTRRQFTYISPSYRALLGFEHLDHLVASLTDDFDLPANSQARQKAKESIQGYRQPSWDLHITCRDGSVRIMEILEVPVFNKAGEVTSVEGICHDVTEARNNLELIKDAQRQLVEQEKLAALGSLVAGLSHEINTPVGIGVTAASHLCQVVQQCHQSYTNTELTRSDFEEFLESSQESADLIASNLNRAADLLQNFKLVATDHSAEMEREFHLKEYLEDVVQSLSPRLRKTGFNIIVDCPGELMMKCDPGSLYQIISNLVMNSLSHGFEGRLVGQISLSAHLENSKLVIEYSDNGNGMSRQDLARLYEPFFTTKRGRGGTGLGMHIVYNNVTQTLGGNISCASKPGKGTRFQIAVPMLAEVEHG